MNQGYNNMPQNNNEQNYNNPVNNQAPMNNMPANDNLQASNMPGQNPAQMQNPVVQQLPDGTKICMDGTKYFPDGSVLYPNGEKYLADGTRVVDTNGAKNNGQNKCPKCGATDVKLNVAKGVLVCEFCRHEFAPEKVEGMVTDIGNLQGQVIGSGASNIAADSKDVMTLKCSSCGAEVVIDTTESTQARCHWCRSILSLNQQVPNGAVPDVVLPFKISKAQAQAKINEFVSKRKFFAHPKFSQEFTTNNIMGVYFPYMLVDVNGHSVLTGQGEHQVRSYTVKSGNSSHTYYDADLFNVVRDFDIVIQGLTVESNIDRLDSKSKNKTNNIINSIMPFDTENCVKYDSHFLKGYTSEKRDTNINDLKPLVESQSKDIARFAANETLKNYDRGVAWSSEQFVVKGQQWQAAYLPVWLYSYQEVKGNEKILHYVAVNARTQETMGSVPINTTKLIITSGIIEIICFIFMLIVDWEYSFLFLAGGIAFYLIMYARYRNSGARHVHEKETRRQMSNMVCSDVYVQRRKGLSNSKMVGANNTKVGADSNGSKISKNLANKNNNNK